VFSSVGKYSLACQNGNWFNAPWGVTLTTATRHFITRCWWNFLRRKHSCVQSADQPVFGDVQTRRLNADYDGLVAGVSVVAHVRARRHAVLYRRSITRRTPFGTLTPVPAD